MLCSFLLRLVPEALADERIAGRVEVVETGEVASVRSAEELIAFISGHGPGRGTEGLAGDDGHQPDNVQS